MATGLAAGLVESGLEIVVPAGQLLDLAKQFRNNDFLATYERKVEFDSATNYTTTQIMEVVLGLDGLFKSINGMETVGKEIAATLRPLIMLPLDDTPGGEVDAISTLFAISPSKIRVLSANDQKIRDDMSDSAQQTATKFKKDTSIDNYETIFYVLTVLAVYYPKKKTFDFYYAYVYCRDTSIWQWALSGDEKKHRMASLEIEGLNLLGTTMAQHSKGIKVVEKMDPEFREQLEAMK
jgi:hypothetical protein